MFEYKIINSDGTQFNIHAFNARIASLSNEAYLATVTPAEHFSYCVDTIIDLLNGGEFMNSARAEAGLPIIKQDYNPQIAFRAFLSGLYKHPAFASDREVLTYSKISVEMSLNTALSSHPNYKQYEQLYNLYLLFKANPTHKGIPQLFVYILVNFKIAGIDSLMIYIFESARQRHLDTINFPAELIPEEFLCPLSSSIMTDPVYDKRLPQQARAEEYYFKKQLAEKGLNPFSRAPMTEGDLKIDEELKGSIALFVEKAIALAKLYERKPQAPYKKFLALLVDDTPVEILAARISLITPATAAAASAGAGAGAGAASASSPSFFGSDRNAHKITIKNYLFKKYETPIDDSSATLEKILRRAAACANPADLQMLLDFFAVNPSVQDAKATSRKSALHWAVTRAQDHKDNDKLVAKYKACVELLVGHGADLHLRDGDGKEAADYDTNKLFIAHLAPASSAAAAGLTK